MAATSTTTATSTATPASEAPVETVGVSVLEEHERTTAYALIGGAYNPDAIALFLGFEKKYTYDRAEGVLWRELYTQYGAELLITGMLRPALFAEFSPIRIFKVRLQYDLWYWPGFSLGKGHGLIFDTKETSFAEADLEKRSGEEIAGAGHRLAIAPTLQLKLWRVVLQSTFELASWYVHGPSGDFWREPLHDTLIARGSVDATLKSFTVLGLELWTGGKDERVIAGGLFEIVRSLRADITRHRIGGVIIATPFASMFGLDRPTLLALAGVNSSDRNREDELWFQVGIRLDYDLSRQ